MRRVQLETALVTLLCFSSSIAIDRQLSGSPPIKIGVVGPLTGRARIFGEIHKRSIELATKELNEKQPPGVKGRNLELVFEDDQSNPARSKQAVEKLATDPNVLAILGPVNSSCAQADLQAAQKRKLPLITSLVTRTDLTDEYAKIAQKSPKEPRYFFQTAVSDRVRTDALVNFIKRQMYPDNIASLKIFLERDSYGEGLRQDFDQLLKQSDARPEVSYGSYGPGFGEAEQPIKDKETRTIRKSFEVS